MISSPATAPDQRLGRFDLFVMAGNASALGARVLVIDPTAAGDFEHFTPSYQRLPPSHPAIPKLAKWADLIIKLATPAS